MKVQVQQNVEILSRGSFEHSNKMFLESRHTVSTHLSHSNVHCIKIKTYILSTYLYDE